MITLALACACQAGEIYLGLVRAMPCSSRGMLESQIGAGLLSKQEQGFTHSLLLAKLHRQPKVFEQRSDQDKLQVSPSFADPR